MSALPDDPRHFVHWAQRNGIAAGSDDFLARRDYGRYLRATLAGAAAAAPGRLRCHPARAARVLPDGSGCTVLLDNGRTVRAEHVVLALGGPAAARPPVVPPELLAHPGYVGDPWRPAALAPVPAGAPVLLIGTGLTAVDVALTLTSEGRAGRCSPLTAVSRHGQVPQAHTAVATPCPGQPSAPRQPAGAAATAGVGDPLRAVVRAVRSRAGQADDWRGVIDGLRPYLDEIWSCLSRDEQESFLRHLARYWESHRHRMAPSVAARVAQLRSTGVLDVRSGGVHSIAAARGAGFDVVLADGVPRWFAAIVNCAGPGRLPGAAGPLVGGLIDAGLARVGPHGLGLDVDAGGRLVGRDGAGQRRIRVVGPLRRGTLWETTAVPELRAQAAQVVADLGADAPAALRLRRNRRMREPRLDAA
jgi:uncharacterized NAD(P)/FAD-binding protein YdhS